MGIRPWPSRVRGGCLLPVKTQGRITSYNVCYTKLLREWLSQQTGKRYRLPTEAEWEYAARSGGKKEKWAGTSVEEKLVDYAWYDDNSGSKTHPVGEKEPNGLGLYDMSVITSYSIHYTKLYECRIFPFGFGREPVALAGLL